MYIYIPCTCSAIHRLIEGASDDSVIGLSRSSKKNQVSNGFYFLSVVKSLSCACMYNGNEHVNVSMVVLKLGDMKKMEGHLCKNASCILQDVSFEVAQFVID